MRRERNEKKSELEAEHLSKSWRGTEEEEEEEHIMHPKSKTRIIIYTGLFCDRLTKSLILLSQKDICHFGSCPHQENRETEDTHLFKHRRAQRKA